MLFMQETFGRLVVFAKHFLLGYDFTKGTDEVGGEDDLARFDLIDPLLHAVEADAVLAVAARRSRQFREQLLLAAEKAHILEVAFSHRVTHLVDQLAGVEDAAPVHNDVGSRLLVRRQRRRRRRR